MNFNSDYQSNQNRLLSSEAVNLSLKTMKTKTKFKPKHMNTIRILCEILFVVVAVGVGYMQGLKSFSVSTDVTTEALNSATIHQSVKLIPENHHEMMQKQK